MGTRGGESQLQAIAVLSALPNTASCLWSAEVVDSPWYQLHIWLAPTTTSSLFLLLWSCPVKLHCLRSRKVVLPVGDPSHPVTAPTINVQSANRLSAPSASSSSMRLCTCALVALAGQVSEIKAPLTSTQMAMVLAMLSMEWASSRNHAFGQPHQTPRVIS